MPKKYTGLAAAGTNLVLTINNDEMFGHDDARTGEIQNAGAGQTG